MRISYWSSDVCSSDLAGTAPVSVRWLSGGATAGWPPAGRCRLGQALFQPPCVGPVFVITGDAPNHSITAFSVEISAERREGKEGVGTSGSRWWPSNKTKKTKRQNHI